MFDWIKDHWRPLMAVQYLIVCLNDFCIAPYAWSAAQLYMHQTLVQWGPLTLSNGGMYHMAMAAVLGVSAWGHSQEKLQEMKDAKSNDAAG